MKYALSAALVGLLATGVCAAQEKSTLKDENARTGYSIGYQIGSDFKRQGIDADHDALLRGIKDAVGGKTPAMSEEDMRATLTALQQKVMAGEQERRRKAGEQARKEGADFMAKHAKEKGVTKTKSGLQYKVLQQGKGKSPKPTDTVVVHYRGTLVDGTEFDSSQRNGGQPVEIPLTNVIKGWQEALPLMKEGAKWQLVIPPDLAYGDRGPMADRTLIFEVELVSVKDTPKPAQ